MHRKSTIYAIRHGSIGCARPNDPEMKLQVQEKIHALTAEMKPLRRQISDIKNVLERSGVMREMGLSPKEVQDYLGHSTVSVTLNIYTHLDWSSKGNAAKAMENAVKLPENVQITSKWES